MDPNQLRCQMSREADPDAIEKMVDDGEVAVITRDGEPVAVLAPADWLERVWTLVSMSVVT